MLELVCSSLHVSLQPLLAGPARFKLPRTVATLRLPNQVSLGIGSALMVRQRACVDSKLAVCTGKASR